VKFISSDAFIKVLNSEDYSTGGGSAAALAGAMAAALAAMVARLSVDKADGLSPDHYQQLVFQAEALRDKLLAGAESDYTAFAAVKTAYARPKTTEREKEERALAIQQAFIGAAEIPAENAAYCQELIALIINLTGKSNPAAGSDLEVARELSTAALKGCLANIVINIPSIKNRATLDCLEQKVAEYKTYLKTIQP